MPEFAEQEAPKLSQISDFAEPPSRKEDEDKASREEEKVFGDQDVDIIVGKGIGNALKYFS